MGLNYSRLNNKVTDQNRESAGWNNLHLSDVTIKHREQLKRGMDDFTGFTWRGVDAFQAFGAFIINNKNTLKFYNGPTYTNEYTKPLFEGAAGQLTGVTFSQQKIDFTIGVYWISEDHYRQLIYWLHPYAVDTLTFDFEDNWYYQVKLASVENGNRYIVGTEVYNGKKEYMYYTEMKVTFEVQGPNCVYRKEMYEFAKQDTKSWKIDTIHGLTFDSDLPTPFQVTLDLDLSKINSNGTYILELYDTTYGIDTDTVEKQWQNDPDNTLLFSINLVKLTNLTGFFSIKYDSETGLCFWNHGDSEYHLLTRLSTLSSGSRFVDSIYSKAYTVEGIFNNPEFKITNLRFTFYDKNEVSSQNIIARTKEHFSMRARSNLI